MRTVKDATLQVAGDLGLTTWFGNPGSTEIPLLADLPDGIRYLLALHENAAVGMAAGHAIATGRPALVSLHTAAGLGNAVNALASARVSRAPLVVLVGQQDRRHIAFEPFLTGRLERLAGDYPVAVHLPLRAQDVPGAVARAYHEAAAWSGPALVIVPMDDWSAAMDDTVIAAPAACYSATGVTATDVAPFAQLLDGARSPVVVAGAGAGDRASWDALVQLADRLGCPVWQEPFTGRAGFPQDHPGFAGFLPAGRAALRDTLAGHDAVLVVGAGVLRQYHYEPGPLFREGTAVAVITSDPAEAHRSPARLALIAPPAAACALLAWAVAPHGAGSSPPRDRAEPAAAPATGDSAALASSRPGGGLRARDVLAGPAGRPGGGLRARDVLAALAARLDPDTIVVEESPSSREALLEMLPATEPLGYLGAAMGNLGFALPAAIGLRLADPARPVLAVLGDGSAIYGIQAMWSAAHYGVGVLFIVLANARYAVMDELASRQGKAPWPGFGEVRLARVADGFGCPAQRAGTLDSLADILDRVIPTLRTRSEPLLVEVDVSSDGEPGR
jgi:benzoylformate decarboxylase